ncbi:acyl--CoA ligase [Sporolactobacillus shoreicorticis]|uniref:AMP-binding protein n=1 Tax=Sporolactobacillus shoreicorticis TaxID=1923877 RepID=A0ABW5S1M2_9BACL|nr:class I adenylate-forming enzyme family protein [Sporolactobacillus shoreicorticis]MCO7127528.1 acyl--CoA ligase [Sporolactobacillus shoreicorticis]
MLYETLVKNVREKGDCLALIYNHIKVTNYGLFQNVLYTSTFLSKHSVNRKRVALCMHNSLELIINLLALSKNNCLILLLNPANIKSLKDKIKVSEVDVTLVEDYLFRDFENMLYDNKIHVLTRSQLPKYSNLNDNFDLNVLNVNEEKRINNYELMQTSTGTTGRAKIAFKTSENLLLDAQNIVTLYSYKTNEIVYCPVPITHGYGLTMGLTACLFSGATLLIQRFFDYKSFSLISDAYKPSLFVGIPAVYKMINDHSDKHINTSSYRTFLCSGDPLNSEIGLEFYECTGKWLSQIYGMMEASLISANVCPTSSNFMSVGRPPDGTKIKIKDELIFIRSKTISDKYKTREGEKEINLINGYFCTNDRGYFDKNNYLFIKGRSGYENNSRKAL